MSMHEEHPLLAWRRKNGITQRALAKLMANGGEPLISYVSLGRIERGEQAPSWAVLERLYEITGGAVSPNDFIGAAPPAAERRG